MSTTQRILERARGESRYVLVLLVTAFATSLALPQVLAAPSLLLLAGAALLHLVGDDARGLWALAGYALLAPLQVQVPDPASLPMLLLAVQLTGFLALLRTHLAEPAPTGPTDRRAGLATLAALAAPVLLLLALWSVPVTRDLLTGTRWRLTLATVLLAVGLVLAARTLDPASDAP